MKYSWYFPYKIVKTFTKIAFNASQLILKKNYSVLNTYLFTIQMKRIFESLPIYIFFCSTSVPNANFEQQPIITLLKVQYNNEQCNMYYQRKLFMIIKKFAIKKNWNLSISIRMHNFIWIMKLSIQFLFYFHINGKMMEKVFY